MREYIVNLTDNLIAKNNYDRLFVFLREKKEFIEHVKIDLETNDVARMGPETSGRIMGSLYGEIGASKAELFDNLSFAGDCKILFRELVSKCLAYVIYARLQPEEGRRYGMTAYCRNKKGGAQ